jgi:uncharacterized membrane protein YczE
MEGDLNASAGSGNDSPRGLSNRTLLVKSLVTSTVVFVAIILGFVVFGFGTVVGRSLIGVAIGAFANIVAKKERATARGLLEYSILGALFVLFLFFVGES